MKQLLWIALIVLAFAGGCHRASDSGGSGDSDADADTDTDTDSETEEYPADGVDLLIAVDNTGSMEDEHVLLAQHVFELIEDLAAEVDALRVAVVSTDMGLQWGGHQYEDGDGWPGDLPSSCGYLGDNGEFESYSSGKTIVLDYETYECPLLNATWAQTPLGDPPEDNLDVAGQAACLTSLGVGGCAWGQQLQALAEGANKPSNAQFHVDGHLLAAIVVSDEDDCSIESNEIFAVDEVQFPEDDRLKLACGYHPQHLYAPSSFLDQLAAPKGGNPNAVLFAAIVGVPLGQQCEGDGVDITSCLEHADMQLVEVIENNEYFFRPACERWDESYQVTKARPGRRFIELAIEHPQKSYVASICNEDWTDLTDDIAQMILDELTD
ncbi:MAG: hypothetical protein JRF63_01065 [Deltaproteobacteria bacterium]|nr:hypothetical protein [Deltaproteobacteria bacterium]